MSSLFDLVIFVVFVSTVAQAGKPDLYYLAGSPPCRIVMMTVKVLGVDVNIKPIDLTKGEQMTPEFLKINPQHTVPVLDDNGFVLSESRAIALYLADMSPNGEKIAPKDLKMRALMEQMLYFDIGRLYQNFMDTYKLSAMGVTVETSKLNVFNESVAMLEEYLTRSTWAAGNQMTIADLSLHSTLSTAEVVGANYSSFPKIVSWMAKTKAAIPDYQIANQEGLDMWKKMLVTNKSG